MTKCLGALSHPKRLEIYKMLKNCDGKTPFSDILKHVYNDDSSKSSSLSNHLGKLVECRILDRSDDGYSLSILGNQLVNQVTNLERIFLHFNKKLMVRTSDYCLEPFDEGKIVSHLVDEGGLLKKDAANIASITKTRLLDAGLNYLTAPLIREFVNVVLLENNFEDVRHQLTRLGLPPSDVSGLMSDVSFRDIGEFYMELGKNIVEQNLLLNHLPQRYADFYLSGILFLLHPESWGLCPSELVLPGPHLADIIINMVGDLNELNGVAQKIQNLSVALMNLFQNFHSFFSRGITITRFRGLISKLADFFAQDETETASLFFKFLPKTNMVSNLDPRNFHNNNWELCLELMVPDLEESDKLVDYVFDLYSQDINFWSNFELDQARDKHRKIKKIISHRPNLIVRFGERACKSIEGLKNTKDLPDRIVEITKLIQSHAVSCVFDGDLLDEEKVRITFTPNLVPVRIPIRKFADQEIIPRPKIVLDKIFINLTRIIQECEGIPESPYENRKVEYKKDKKDFINAFRQVLFNAINLFDRKYKLIIKNLPRFKRWTAFSQKLFKRDFDLTKTELDEYAGKIEINCAISLNGLLEAVRFYTGFYPDQKKSAFMLMVEILGYANDLLKNNSNNSNVNYLLVQPHLDNYLESHFIQDAEILKKMSSEFIGVDHEEMDSLFDMLKRNKCKERDSKKNYTITNYMNQNALEQNLKKIQPYWVTPFRAISLENYKKKLDLLKAYQDEFAPAIAMTLDSKPEDIHDPRKILKLLQDVYAKDIFFVSFNRTLIVKDDEKVSTYYRYCGCFKPLSYFSKMLQNKITERE